MRRGRGPRYDARLTNCGDGGMAFSSGQDPFEAAVPAASRRRLQSGALADAQRRRTPRTWCRKRWCGRSPIFPSFRGEQPARLAAADRAQRRLCLDEAQPRRRAGAAPRSDAARCAELVDPGDDPEAALMQDAGSRAHRARCWPPCRWSCARRWCCASSRRCPTRRSRRSPRRRSAP